MLKHIPVGETMIQIRKAKTVKESAAVKPQLKVRSKLEIIKQHINQEFQKLQFDLKACTAEASTWKDYS